jgi:delta24-sterol reductase
MAHLDGAHRRDRHRRKRQEGHRREEANQSLDTPLPHIFNYGRRHDHRQPHSKPRSSSNRRRTQSALFDYWAPPRAAFEFFTVYAARMLHDQRVRQVCEMVKARPAGKRLTIRKAHPGHTPHDLAYKSDCHAVNVDGLDTILAIDAEARTADVEGQVTLGQLCRESFARGLLPKVVPEFQTFTVAGLVNGLGIETSSHRHGVFPATLAELEVVLGNGEVVVADEKNHSDLLSHLPGSYGTLGVVTRAKLHLQPSQPFVRSRYRRFRRRKDYVAAFRDALEEHEFVEGFVFALDSYVLITADYSPKVALDVFGAAQPGNPWYYQHADEMAERDGEDLIPSLEYLFRHERSLMWMAGIIADLKLFSHTRWGRRYLDDAVKKRVGQSGFQGNLPSEIVERCLINQDMGIRLSRLEEGIEYVQKNLDVHPLWNCPAGAGSLKLAFATSKKLLADPEMLVDIGVYGEPRVRNYRHFDAMRALQKFVDNPSFWGVCYLSREELRDLYDFDSYEAVQRKYHATDAFVPIESKIRFMKRPEKQGPVPLWRLLNLYYDLRGR